jgi:hypothetical protein
MSQTADRSFLAQDASRRSLSNLSSSTQRVERIPIHRRCHPGHCRLGPRGLGSPLPCHLDSQPYLDILAPLSADLPLSLPEGWKDPDTPCGRPIYRKCELALKRMGISVFWCLLPTMKASIPPNEAAESNAFPEWLDPIEASFFMTKQGYATMDELLQRSPAPEGVSNSQLSNIEAPAGATVDRIFWIRPAGTSGHAARGVL